MASLGYNYTLDENIKQEYIREIAMMFFPLSYKTLPVKAYVKDNFVKVSIDDREKEEAITLSAKNSCKKALYKLLADMTGRNFPYGILTGVKPLNVLSLYAGKSNEELKQILKEDYLVSESKADLILKTKENENSAIKNLFGLYIHIPYCPSRCEYCSFPSFICSPNDNRLNFYTDALIYELSFFKDIIKKSDINTIYIGGGTASILNKENIKKLLNAINSIGLKTNIEFTFEAGRSDMLSKEKLKIFKDGNVNRICLNPQTFNEDALKNYNRFISLKSFYEMYNEARKIGFNSINCDLILGLTNSEDFLSDVKKLIELKADNITLHTLALKRASKMEEMEFFDENFNEKYDECVSLLIENAYSPYYLYKQKFALSGGENIGFCIDKKICNYNILTMSGKHPVLSFGAGGQTKIKVDNNLERIDTTKDPKQYIENIEKICKRKMDRLMELV